VHDTRTKFRPNPFFHTVACEQTDRLRDLTKTIRARQNLKPTQLTIEFN